MKTLRKIVIVVTTGLIVTGLTSVIAKQKQSQQTKAVATSNTVNTQPQPITNEPFTYCPSIALIKTLCQSKQAYNKDIEPFPECLTLNLNQTIKTSDGFTWKLDSINPPSLSNGFHFLGANLDQRGTHCTYRTNDPGHIVIFTLLNQQRLSPSLEPLQKPGMTLYWKSVIETKYHVDLDSAKGDEGNILMCSPKKEDKTMPNGQFPVTTDCPFVNPNYRGS